MGSRQTTVDFILEQIATAGTVNVRKMFGEYAVYCDSKVVGLICDDQLFIKPTEAGRGFAAGCNGGGFAAGCNGRGLAAGCNEGYPYPGAKPWLLISGDTWDDKDWLVRLIQLTAAALPMPKQKPAQRKKKT
jgi:hypothetical protein